MSRILMVGSHGREVAAVQQALNRYCPPQSKPRANASWPEVPLAVDSRYGPLTESAVRRFQAAAGFTGRDVDGKVGPKTTLALFQVFDMKIAGKLAPATPAPANSTSASPAPVKPSNPAPQPPKVVPKPPEPGKAPEAEDPPKHFQGNAQLGYQLSKRDGSGLQLSVSLTFRTRDYFPRSRKNAFYHGLHTEIMLQPALGIPLPPSSIFTGQLGVTVQPVTDWLVLWDRLHLFTPAVGVFGQIPFNSPNGLDPSSHSRLGFSVGMELFHVDVIKDHLAIGVSGQESGYWDFKDRQWWFDPSALVFLQGTFP